MKTQKIKKFVVHSLIAIGLIGSASAQTLLTTNDFTLSNSGNGCSSSLTIDYLNEVNGSPSFKINMFNGSYASWVSANYTSATPITEISYQQYEQYGTSSPFYNYLYIGPTTFAWLDSGYGGSIQDFGGTNYYPSLARSVGWHTIDAIVNSNSISYSIDNVLVATCANTNPLYTVGFNLSSAGGGSYSYDISQVVVAAVPEPSSYVLFCIGSIGLMMLLRRKTTA